MPKPAQFAKIFAKILCFQTKNPPIALSVHSIRRSLAASHSTQRGSKTWPRSSRSRRTTSSYRWRRSCQHTSLRRKESHLTTRTSTSSRKMCLHGGASMGRSSPPGHWAHALSLHFPEIRPTLQRVSVFSLCLRQCSPRSSLLLLG